MSGASNIVSITRYDAQGRVIETRMPANTAGGDAHATLSTYYSGTGTGNCVNAAEAGLVCQTTPAAQPTSGPNLLSTTTTYNMWGAPLTVTESNGTGTRTTTTLYDPAQRECVHSITTAGVGDAALPAVYKAYEPNTGAVTQTGNISGSTPATCPASPPTMSNWILTTYDSDGRVSTYIDASNNLSSVSYTADGLIATINDGKGSVTYTYDGVSGEHRRLLTSLTDSQVGTFNATYDAEGGIVSETYPSGLVATHHFDDIGQTKSLAYAMGSTTWLSFSASYSAHGQIVAQSSNGSSQLFSYDNAGRLIQVADTDQTVNPIACTTRVYAYDADSNRLSLTSYPGSSPGVCSTSTTPTVTSHTYDQADRISSSGYTYDPMGRTTSVPASDAGGTNALTNGYYVNDMVASQVQGTSSKSFGLDPTERLTTITTGASVQTNLYAGGSDSPAWISVSDGSWTRNVQDIGGNLAAIVSSTGSDELQLTNLHGDVVATAPNVSNAAGIDAYFESTEFGVPRASNTADPRYAWLGGKRRDSGDALAGIVLMGARLYSPTLGRFLQVDPVAGGSANDYDYCFGDPINRSDLAGTFDFWGGLQSGMVAIGRALPGGARGAYGSAVAGTGSWAGQEHADLTSGDPLRVGMATLQVVWTVGTVVPGPGEGIGIAARLGVRFTARNLAEKLALKEAMGGAGRRIMQGRIKDLRYPGWLYAKMSHIHVHPGGVTTEIHYWQNLVTGRRFGFKFKD
ncbi:MAG TPA: RHS repeat-associated core domain-containing protein [Candidatus Micrarchaeaceae archaeon]|nr:RHS repeat-associated core domain-containing protein [Candidatus Micrarchaeaceae archaeon]